MKNKIILLSVLFTFGFIAQAQDYGRIIIGNADKNFPPIIVSLNGVRLQNDYAPVVTYKFADETIYRVKILQSGYTGLLRFNIGSEPRYVSTYLLTKDATGAFTLILQSKSLMTGNEDNLPVVSPTVAPTPTIAAEPTHSPTVFQGPLAMTAEVYNHKLNEVKAKNFDDEKLERIKEAFEFENFTTNQVIGLMKLFSFDDKKIETAKFAYPKTIDQENFYKTYDLLSFSSSKSNLKDWIKNNK